MKLYTTATAAFLLTLSAAAAAAGPTKSSFFTNDFIGDGHDRWRSGSYSLNLGYEDDRFGVPYDIRLRSEIISGWGSSLQSDNDDRMYVGALGLGAFVNQNFGFADLTLGGEILAVGDQTGMADLQGAAHDAFGMSNDSYNPDTEPHAHIEDKFTGMLSAEGAMNYYFGSNGLVRPYAGAQYGYETFLRAGADVVIGNMSNADRWSRDPVSGFIQPSSSNRADAMEGFNLVAGLDFTAVTDSEFFPSESDVDLEPMRVRARLGGQASFGGFSVFYGATHLTKEFESQYEGQTVGTISIERLF